MKRRTLSEEASMSYVGYGQSPYIQEPKVRFDAIGEAWTLVREKMGVWAVAALVVGGGGTLLNYGISFAAQAIFGGVNPNPTPGNPMSVFTPGYFLSLTISSITGMVINAFLASSLFGLALKQVRGQEIELADAFKFGSNIGNVIVTNLLVGLLTTVGFVLCYIPGIIVALAMTLAAPIAIDKGVGGPEAVSQSWQKMKGNLLMMFGIVIVLSLLVLVSMIPLGLGLLVTVPLYIMTIAIIYRDFFDNEMTMRGPTLDMPLPPSSAYGAGAPGTGGAGQYNAPGTTPGQTPPPPPAAPGQMAGLDM
ncbi:MAG: hypothetical protein H7Y38_10030 [Armatimonadetes bacterium]|nr:hypothetical protein [Armatimonadota bacterium]